MTSVPRACFSGKKETAECRMRLQSFFGLVTRTMLHHRVLTPVARGCNRQPLMIAASIPQRRHTAAAAHPRRPDICASLPSSELVTRSLLVSSASLMHAGIGPAGVCAFASALGANAGSSSSSIGDLPSSLRVTFSPVTGDTAEQLCDCLLGLGAQSVVIEEARQPGGKEQQVFGAEAALWDLCQVMAHFDTQHDVAATVEAARDILELPDLSFSQEQVVDQEWEAQIKASYVPVQVCEGLFIIPDWHDEPVAPGATSIRLTPGVAFGTGEHPTTKLCLRELQAVLPGMQGCTVMDYGAGSGVLALAALLLGGRSAVATDIDELAVRACRANAELNGVQQQLVCLQCGPSLSDDDPLLQLPDAAARQFDLVVANILRGPLLELQPRLTSYCKPQSGRLLVSGILTEQAPDIIAAYSPFFQDFKVSSEGSWALVTAVRR